MLLYPGSDHPIINIVWAVGTINGLDLWHSPPCVYYRKCRTKIGCSDQLLGWTALVDSALSLPDSPFKKSAPYRTPRIKLHIVALHGRIMQLKFRVSCICMGVIDGNVN